MKTNISKLTFREHMTRVLNGLISLLPFLGLCIYIPLRKQYDKCGANGRFIFGICLITIIVGFGLSFSIGWWALTFIAVGIAGIATAHIWDKELKDPEYDIEPELEPVDIIEEDLDDLNEVE